MFENEDKHTFLMIFFIQAPCPTLINYQGPAYFGKHIWQTLFQLFQCIISEYFWNLQFADAIFIVITNFF